MLMRIHLIIYFLIRNKINIIIEEKQVKKRGKDREPEGEREIKKEEEEKKEDEKEVDEKEEDEKEVVEEEESEDEKVVEEEEKEDEKEEDEEKFSEIRRVRSISTSIINSQDQSQERYNRFSNLCHIFPTPIGRYLHTPYST